MATWVQSETIRYVWITIFFILIVLFNLLNVRRYGEIEYWMTVTKLVTIVGIIVLGVLLPLGVSTQTRQLATAPDNQTVEYCSTPPGTNTCLPLPGFDCTPLSTRFLLLMCRLENRPRFQSIPFHRRLR